MIDLTQLRTDPLTVVQLGLRIDVQSVNPGAGWSDPSNLFTTNYLRTDPIYYGQPSQIIRPDGTMQLFAYDQVPLPWPPYATATRITTRTGGQFNYADVVDGTLQETWTAQNGLKVLEVQTDILSSIVTSSNLFVYGNGGHLIATIYMDGTQELHTYDCCHLLSTTQRDGNVISYTHDALNRLVTINSVDVTTSNVLDSVGAVVAVVRYGTDGSMITTSQTAYDTGGQQVSSTDGLNNTATYTNYLDASSQFIRETTYPDLTTRIETYARDGSLLKVTGTAIHGLRYEYGVQSDGGVQRRYTKEFKLDGSGNDTTEWTKTLTDAAGRAYKVLYADSTPGTETDNPFSQSTFNNQGQLVSQRDPDGVFTLSQYNRRSEPEYTALDLNTNGVIDFAGADRVTRTVTDVISNAVLGANVRRARVYGWNSNSSAVSNLLSATETSVNGLHTWQTTYRDPATAVTNRTDTVYGGGGYRYQTNTAPDGSHVVSQYVDGRLTSVIRSDSLNTQLSALSYSYDSQGRQSQVIDARNGTTTYGFNTADLVTSVTTPAPGNGQNPQTTSTAYDNRLQVSSVAAPDGATTTFEYYPSGELKRSYGGRNYPVGYSYDYAGRAKTMTNWTSFSSGATTWNYNTNRGWLDNKRYDNNQGPDYTYTAGGRLRTRTWARIGTSSTRISTTYTYGFNDASANDEHGDLLTVTYANDPQSTPSITNTYDRRGRTATVARNGITTTFAYNDASEVLSESCSGGTLDTWAVTNAYDLLLRRTNLTILQSNNPLIRQARSFDAASRLTSATDGTNSATYSYLANSPLVSQITFASNAATRMTTTKSYDFLNRLTSIGNSPIGSSAIGYSYAYNDANQRIRVAQADGSFWLLQYDSLGQVISGKKYWSDLTPVAGQQFEYADDDIGNRTSTKAGGDQTGSNLRVATYSVNDLNQYTNRTVPGAVDITGVANTATTVTVNNQSTSRKVEYYRKELSIANTSAPQWQSVTNQAVQSGTTNATTGNVFLPKTPETFTYDADGNLLSDGRWTNSWDAENRLIVMQGLSNLPAGANLLLQFEYDWQGRRIRKQVSTWNGSGYSLSSDAKVIYDGWNCIAEINSTNQAVLRRYMWGLDLSGSQQGAGGVGGMLAVQDVAGGTGTHFAAYDGNGNVVALIKASDGTPSANYEYGPFGELLRATGPMAKVNCIQFSSKYRDNESDLIYYGFRFYNPNIGRWINRDPAGERGGVNLYVFVRNSPPHFVDYLGRSLLGFICCKDECTKVDTVQIDYVKELVLPSQLTYEGYEQVATKLEGLEYISLVEELSDPIHLAINRSLPSITSVYRGLVGQLGNVQFCQIHLEVKFKICAKVPCWVVWSHLKWIPAPIIHKVYVNGASDPQSGYAGFDDAKDHLTDALTELLDSIRNDPYQIGP